jgi:hypothetical protein
LPKAHELAAGETGVHLVTRAGAPPSLRRSKSAQPEHGSVARSTKGQRNLLRRRKMVTPGWGPRPNMPGRCAQTSCQTTNSLEHQRPVATPSSLRFSSIRPGSNANGCRSNLHEDACGTCKPQLITAILYIAGCIRRPYRWSRVARPERLATIPALQHERDKR